MPTYFQDVLSVLTNVAFWNVALALSILLNLYSTHKLHRELLRRVHALQRQVDETKAMVTLAQDTLEMHRGWSQQDKRRIDHLADEMASLHRRVGRHAQN